MARVKRGSALKNKHRKVLKATKGFRGAPNRLANVAERAWLSAHTNAYRDRRRRRREFRRLWIVRINAAVRNEGLRYGEFMDLLKKNNIELDRKQLSEMAFNSPETFTALVNSVKP